MLEGKEKLSVQERNYIEHFWHEICEAGEELRKKELPKLTKEDFYLFQKTGNRLVYEKAYFGRRRFLTVFGILTEFGENAEDVQKLTQVLEEVCQETYWALPAHVDFKNPDKNTIDLFASETAATLAEMAYLFYDKLPQETTIHMLHEVIKRVIEPFAVSTFPYSWWETDKCNWSAVCGGNLGIAVLYLDKIEKQYHADFLRTMTEKLPPNWKETILDRVCQALSCYLDGMEEDGACTEGLGYFSYGMSYFTAFVELYEEAGKTDADIKVHTHFMELPKCEKIACFQQKCFFEKGISLSFSDGSCRESFLPGLTDFLADCYESVEVPDYSLARDFEADACYRWLTNERNIRWILRYAQGDRQKEKDGHVEKAYFLPSAQWMIYQNRDMQGKSIGYACKGGNNDENHNHNDIGSFLCVYDGEMFLTDLGAGEYTKDYFNEGRYGILCNRSLGHNVPLVEGKEQLCGKEHHAERFVWDEKAKKLEISYADAYAPDCLEYLERSIRQEESEIVVTDRFRFTEKGKSITENLITVYEPEIKGDCVLIKGKENDCMIWVQTCQKPVFRIIPKEHSMHDGRKKTVYLIQWDVTAEEAKRMDCVMKISFQCSILQKTNLY